MEYCERAGCNGILTKIYSDQGWQEVCTQCRKERKLPDYSRTADSADLLAANGYIAAQDLYYQEAEKSFLKAARTTEDEDLRSGYSLWAFLCHFGVEYVCEEEFDGHAQVQRYHIIFARFPLADFGENCEAVALFREMWQQHPSKQLADIYNAVRVLHQQIRNRASVVDSADDVFIAWHDRGNSRRCQDFAKELDHWLLRKRQTCFVSFESLLGIDVNLYESFIYNALSKAKVFVIVIDDYDALGRKFLKWEIKRMIAKARQEEVSILFNGMQGHTGTVPEFMANWQLHYQDSTTTPDRVEIVGQRVLRLLEANAEGPHGQPSIASGHAATSTPLDRSAAKTDLAGMNTRRLHEETKSDDVAKALARYEEYLDAGEFEKVKQEIGDPETNSLYRNLTDAKKGRLYKYLLWAERELKWSDNPHGAIAIPFYGPYFNTACRYGYRLELESINHSLLRNIHDFVELEVDLEDKLRYQVDDPSQCGNDYRYLWECILYQSHNLTEVFPGIVEWFQAFKQSCPMWLFDGVKGVCEGISTSLRTKKYWASVRESANQSKIKCEEFLKAQPAKLKKDSDTILRWRARNLMGFILLILLCTAIAFLCAYAATTGFYYIICPKGVIIENANLLSIHQLIDGIRTYTPNQGGIVYLCLILHCAFWLVSPALAVKIWKRIT